MTNVVIIFFEFCNGFGFKGVTIFCSFLSHGKLLFCGLVYQIFFSVFSSIHHYKTGKVDIDDLFAGSDTAAATLFIHFLAERFNTPNYQQNIADNYNNSLAAYIKADSDFETAKAISDKYPTSINISNTKAAEAIRKNAELKFQTVEAQVPVSFRADHRAGLIAETSYVKEVFSIPGNPIRKDISNPNLPNVQISQYGNKELHVTYDPQDKLKVIDAQFK